MRLRKYGVLFPALLLLFCAGCKKGGTTVAAQASASSAASTQSGGVVAYGQVKYNNEYQISIDFPARVENIAVKEGDAVKKGSTLVTLSTDDYQKSIRNLQIQADSAKGTLSDVNQAALKADIDVLKNQIATKTKQLNSGSSPDLQLLQNSLTLAQKEEKQAQEDLNKYKTLLASGVIAQSDYDKSSDALDQKTKAEKDVVDNIAKTKQSLKDELDSLNVSLKSKQVQLSQQDSAASAAQISLDLMSAKAQKPYLSGNNIVCSLTSGIVKEIDVVDGTVIPGQTPLKVIDLIDADSIYVSTEVPEEFIGQVSEKSKVYIVPTADKSQKIPGHVIQIENQAVDKDGDLIVKVQVKPDTASTYLKPGYTSDVHFTDSGSK